MGTYNRRAALRIPLQMHLNEHTHDTARRCLSFNLSPTGVYVNRLVEQMQSGNRVVGLEFELPNTSEVVWARGEVVYDKLDPFFHGKGIRFTGMADKHKRLLRDYVVERRLRQLDDLLASIRRNRKLPKA